ncbi:uncharacterized protein L969DRAFT_92443 [Mixia osmundae IAM 14324]|uniref:Uncharacterized protein n=1 Tax=Mixia osmundae (strain CBS 9802 / IAM 14324 / JCM 22182 / KY 12970) TaxID=764103 RepID=G7DXI7_MIXOS|nr:uncharacterized protein L969DRAFT_92443 [Mixia osmundae IAM 14324]KEI41209.1 hypothetical protein L969DRAFT_92443 [Mixia osmundae IAM 14324]GAA95297.1 hypothetical protein E5Q_01954 [Mixia osmundae IAM 14324]
MLISRNADPGYTYITWPWWQSFFSAVPLRLQLLLNNSKSDHAISGQASTALKMRSTMIPAALVALFAVQTLATVCHDYNHEECLQWPEYCGWNAALGCIVQLCSPNCKPLATGCSSERSIRRKHRHTSAREDTTCKMQSSSILVAFVALFVAQTSAFYCADYNHEDCLQWPQSCGWNAAIGCLLLPCSPNCKP